MRLPRGVRGLCSGACSTPNSFPGCVELWRTARRQDPFIDVRTRAWGLPRGSVSRTGSVNLEWLAVSRWPRRTPVETLRNPSGTLEYSGRVEDRASYVRNPCTGASPGRRWLFVQLKTQPVRRVDPERRRVRNRHCPKIVMEWNSRNLCELKLPRKKSGGHSIASRGKTRAVYTTNSPFPVAALLNLEPAPPHIRRPR